MSRYPWQQNKSSPKKGRRSGFPSSLFQSSPQKHEDDDIGNSDDLLSSPIDSPEQEILRPSRRTGGWADEIPKSGKNRKGFGQDYEDERLRPSIVDDDSDSEIPVIPDLDDVQEEDLANQVAQAPQMMVNRVATYKELDSDLLKHAAFATLDDIDLRVLMRCLAPESEVKEEETPWTWDVLFTEVTSELNAERDSHNEIDRALSA